ncbi:MAG: hypothetical protein M3376_10175 [Actinomycetota bacterium]|nr:hypothetical protein [Actinomycetota bacterium]
MKRPTKNGAGHGAPRRIGPAVLQLVSELQVDEPVIEISLSVRAAAAIDRIDARRAESRRGGEDPYAAVAEPIRVDPTTASRWHANAWQAVSEGLLAPAEAQALSDQLEPRGAA